MFDPEDCLLLFHTAKKIRIDTLNLCQSSLHALSVSCYSMLTAANHVAGSESNLADVSGRSP